MATVLSNFAFDQDDLNLNRLYAGAQSFGLLENVNYVYNNISYTDIYYVNWIDYGGGDFYQSNFAGPNVVADESGAVTGGTVTGYLEFIWDGSAYVPTWGIQEISVPAAELYAAATTTTVSDDYALINSELDGADTFFLSNYADTARGMGGDDIIYGYAGNDRLFGGDGDDILVGGLGNDTIDGGADSDTAFYVGTDTDYTVTDNGGGSFIVTDNNAADGDDGTDTLIDIESIVFSNYAPTGAPTVLLANGTEDVPYPVAASDLLAGFSDPDGDDLSVANLSASVGTVTDNGNGTFTIGLPGNFDGSVTLTYDVVDGNGGVLPDQTRAFSVDPDNDARHDYNGDGTSDILWFNSATNAVGQYQMNDGAATWGAIGQAGPSWEAVGSGDYNGDGTSDILWFNASTGSVGQYEMNDGAATWQGIGRAGGAWEAVDSGDYNGDGTDDILWFNASTGSVGQYEMNDGVATWASIGTAGSAWEVVGSGDYNGDGTDDILWFNAGTGSVGQYEMNDGVATWRGIGTAGSNWEAVDSGDYNGDGTDDILWFNATSGTVGQFQMNDGVAAWGAIGRAGPNWEVVGSGDYNGDGTDDILWFNAATGSVGQYEMNDGVATWQGIGTAGGDWEVIA